MKNIYSIIMDCHLLKLWVIFKYVTYMQTTYALV